jgi:hypothetical protein
LSLCAWINNADFFYSTSAMVQRNARAKARIGFRPELFRLRALLRKRLATVRLPEVMLNVATIGS